MFDVAVIIAYFVVIISIGLYKGRGEKTMEGYAVGDRNIPWWAVLASILAAEVSAGTFIGTPSEGYALRNFTYAQLSIGTIIARVIVAYVFIQRFYDLKVVSIYEFLHTRFGQTTKLASSAVFLITRVIASGARMYVPAILLVVAWKLQKGIVSDAAHMTHEQISQTVWLYVAAITVLVLITAVYTTFGGIKAVVWTDFIQVFLMFGAMGYATSFLWHAIGGWEQISTAARQVVVDPAIVQAKGAAAAQEQAQRVASRALTFWDTGIVPGKGFWGNVKNVLETEYTVWSAFLASVFVTMATHGTDQDMVQRMLTAPDVKRSRRSLILSGLADIPIAVCFTFIGILLWVYYQMPAHASLRPAGDYFSTFIVQELPVGIRGIMAAGLFATAMGSLSTALNALATSFTRDFYLGVWRKSATSHEQMVAARVCTALFAVILAGVAIGTAWLATVHTEIRPIPIVLGSFGYTYGSLLGIFLVGMMTKTRGNAGGNLLAMLLGFIAVAILSGLPNDVAALFLTDSAGHPAHLYAQPEWLPVIEFPWRILFGTLVTAGVALCFRTPAAQVQANSEAQPIS